MPGLASFSGTPLICSDCKQSLCERRWTQVLLNWINNCVLPGSSFQEITQAALVDALSKYKVDIRDEELNQILRCSDDLETFLSRKYPILTLSYHIESDANPRKLYTMGSVVLYYCCVSSRTGAVDADICKSMDSKDQELILKYCENLGDMEVTISNVDSAIAGAFDKTPGLLFNKISELSEQVSSQNTMENSSESNTSADSKSHRIPAMKLKSSMQVVMMSSVEMSDITNCTDSFVDESKNEPISDEDSTFKVYSLKEMEVNQSHSGRVEVVEHADAGSRTEPAFHCKRCVLRAEENKNPGCSCVHGPSEACCGDTGGFKAANDSLLPKDASKVSSKRTKKCDHVKWIFFAAVPIVVVIALVSSFVLFDDEKPKATSTKREVEKTEKRFARNATDSQFSNPDMHWECKNNLCQILHQRPGTGQLYPSLSRCTLLCTGPQLWPYPIGNTYFSNQLIAIAKNKLEYKFQTVPSTEVNQYLGDAFHLFLKNLAKLEISDLNVKNDTQDLPLMKINIQIDVESDPDPKLRIDTEESYKLQIDTFVEEIKVTIASPSFCGVRHGLETLSQLILIDQSTGFLITLSRVMIRDGPSYKYRGLMIDTARNYIPVPDLMRTLDAMASCKLNTFHWRISDATSFPLLLPDFPELFEFGGYDRSMVYTVEDIKELVNRAGVRGIRVLLEVAAPGPVGRPWSWTSDTTCPSTNANLTCEDTLCLKLKMTTTILNVLESIYTFIIDVTKVDDIFHMSDGVFSYSRCYYTLDDREFLEKALARLKLANKGFLPRLPIVWYTAKLAGDYEMNTWNKFGVQLNEWDPKLESEYLSGFKVIHSSKWDLSCEIKKRRCNKYRSWQEMYAWKSWRTLEVLTIEGGEAILWTDLVDTSNLDAHLWPRAAAVAERLWSDVVANHTAGANEYLRLDAQRWRMLLLSVKVEPIWPVWCSFNPRECLKKIR